MGGHPFNCAALMGTVLSAGTVMGRRGALKNHSIRSDMSDSCLSSTAAMPVASQAWHFHDPESR
jgi:hypothetical protein